jgi:DNA helicase IV
VTAARRELLAEQRYVDRLYARLDELRDVTRERLVEVRRRGATGTPQARSERDAFATMYEDRLAQLNAVEGGLCFGRLDMADRSRHYIGRIGLSDEQHESLLVDWRAPAAEPFYRATPASPQGVSRRRHLRSRGREVVAVDDDVFELEALSETDRGTLSGEAALLAALSEHRTGRMRDIVATIQAEQDRVIRSEMSGVLVVQGGPGTGKTAVALHRAAYLLYTHRERLARSGVLVVGPNPVFTRYIEQVLPSLGETGVRLATLEQLVPGVAVEAADTEPVATVKGDARLARVLRNAVAAYQRVPDHEVVVPFEDGELRLDRTAYDAARRRAQRSRRPHNLARLTFARALLEDLVVQACALLDTTPRESRWVTRSIMRSEEFRAAVNLGWPRLSPQELIGDLLADERLLEGAARSVLSPDEWRVLLRPAGSPWTAADVPLLDESRVLLGDVDTVLERARERRERRKEREYAQEVLELTGVGGRVDPDRLAARYRETGSGDTVAERAAADPAWEFGHVIVDEAQELSAMGWRMLARRCPSLSMTVVGDIAQTGVSWGARSWADMLEPMAPGRWRVMQLSVNYRTPVEIMDVAADVLAAVDPDAVPPTSVREAGEHAWVEATDADALVDALAARLTADANHAAGTTAVLVPGDLHDALADALAARVDGVSAGGPGSLDARIAVLPVTQAKGLEFDSVIVVEPGRILEATSHGGNDLYVALTRATARLGVVHSEPLPAVLSRLTTH